MESKDGFDGMGWGCERCGHAVPIDNREVHEARCGRDPSPTTAAPRPPRPRPPPPTSALTSTPSPAPLQLSPPDADAEEAPSRNVFTPGIPPPPEAPQQPTPPPQQQQQQPAAARPWREVDLRAATATAQVREQLQQLQQLQQRQQQQRRHVQERRQSRERPLTSSSSSSPESGYAFIGANAAGPRTGEGAAAAGATAAGAGAGTGAAGAEAGVRVEGDERETTWACGSCTFLNGLDVSRCGMCGTRMSPQQRPPDSTYRDTLIDDSPLAGGARGQRRRLAGVAADLDAAAEEARCRLLAAEVAAGRGISTSGGGSGGRGGRGTAAGDGGDGPLDTGGAVSGAAAGSVLGALSAGMLSAIQPGARPGRVLASVVHGALMGGAAGAALAGLSDQPRAGGSGRVEGEGGGGVDDLRRQRQRQLSFEFVEHPRDALTRGGEGAGGDGLDLEESLMLARRMEAMNLHEAAAQLRREGMRGMVEGPNGILRRRTTRRVPRAGGGGGGGEDDEDGTRPRPASARAIAALPEMALTDGSLSHLKDDGRQCCICLEDFGAGDKVKRLQCLHLYHTFCIENWLQTSGTCPQCKHRVD